MGTNWVKIAERRLERAGWLESVAGKGDWLSVVTAFAAGMEAEPRRGALLSGSFGCGKTMAATALYRVEGTDAKGNWFTGVALPCAEAEEWPAFDAGAAFNAPQGWTILDDMGAEAAPDFGKKDPVAELVMRLHKRWAARVGCGIAVTTNLTGEQMAARYGGRVMSRVMEMVVPVVLAGRDKRKRVTVG